MIGRPLLQRRTSSNCRGVRARRRPAAQRPRGRAVPSGVAGRLWLRATPELLARVMEEEMARIQAEVGPERFRKGRYAEAGRIFSRQCTAPELDDFLTLDAYNLIVVHHPGGASPCKL